MKSFESAIEYFSSKGEAHDCRSVINLDIDSDNKVLSLFIEDINHNSEGYKDYCGPNPMIAKFENIFIFIDDISIGEKFNAEYVRIENNIDHCYCQIMDWDGRKFIFSFLRVSYLSFID